MIKWLSKKRNQKGFTLIELVVVVAILGILLALAIPRFTDSRLRAAVNAHNANVRMIESAGSVFMAETNKNSFTAISELEDYLDLPIAIPALIDTTETEYEATAEGGLVTVEPGLADEEGKIN